MLETGQPWVIDFRTVPHWLNAGATQSGKSTLANAIIKGLAPQPAALAGSDLKGGVEFIPYAPRLSALATTRAESCDLSTTSSASSATGCGPAASTAHATSGGSPTQSGRYP